MTRVDLVGPARLQADYYARTAQEYDAMHLGEADEHAIALGFLASIVAQRGFSSVLDVGSGTGRALCYLKRAPGLAVRGVEPVAELREVAYQNGVLADELTEGSALALPFEDASFDVVCSFGVLHHIKDHRRAVAEMCRVAKRAIFISDANNFGQGSVLARALKQTIRAFGLWRAFDLLRTRGKGFHYSEGDGVYYSYTLLDDVPVLRRKFPNVIWLGTAPSGSDLYRSAGSVAIFASREEPCATDGEQT